MAHVTPLPRRRRVKTPSMSVSAGWVRREASERSAAARGALRAAGVNDAAHDVVHSVRTETGEPFEVDAPEQMWRTTIRLAGSLSGNRKRVREIAADVARRMDEAGKTVHSVYAETVRTVDGTWPMAIFVYSCDPQHVGGGLTGRVAFR